MTRSEELFERAKAVIPGGVSSPVRAFKAVGGTPLFVARAEGARFWDADGRAFIDYVGSWGPMILGHAHPAVLEAVRDAAARGTSYGAPCAARGGAGRARRAPRAVGREGALRLVRHRGHDERAAGRARLHRPAEDPQVRRLLPRPRRLAARLGRLRRRDPRHPRLARRARGHGGRHARRALQRRRRRSRRSWPRTDATSPRSSSSPCAGTWARSRRSRATSRRCARSRAGTARCSIFDEVMTGFRLALGRRAAALRHPARHDLPRQDHRRRAAGGGLRRPGRHHGARSRPRAPSTRRARSPGTRWRWPRARRSSTSSRGPAPTRRSRRRARGSRRASGAPPATPARRSRSTASAR